MSKGRILTAGAGVVAPLFKKIYLEDGEERRREIPVTGSWNPEDLARYIFDALDDSDGVPVGWISYRPLSSIWASSGLYTFLEWSRRKQGRDVVKTLLDNVEEIEVFTVEGYASEDLKAYVREHGDGLQAPSDAFPVGYLVSFKGKPLLLDDVKREFCRATDWLEYVKLTNKRI